MRACIILFIAEGHPVLMSHLPQSCQSACSCAVYKLENILHRLHTGNISNMELKEIEGGQDGIKLLCEATYEKDKAEGRSEISSSTGWRNTLTKRLQEYEEFEKQRKFLSVLCQNIPKHVTGIYV